jgi:signal transduction histidine kinase
MSEKNANVISEQEFLRAYDFKSFNEARWSLIAAGIMVLISGPLDYFTFPLSGISMVVVVYGYELPILLIGLFAFRKIETFLKYSYLLPFIGMLDAVGIIMCLSFIKPDEPAFTGFVHGALGLAIIWIIASNKTRPVHSLCASVILVLLFNITWFARGFNDFALFAGANFFMMSLILLGFVGTRSMKKLLLADFLKSKIIEEEKEKISTINAALKKSFEVNNMLTSLVSHDVRAPLNSLKGILELFIDGVITDSQFRKCLVQITGTIESTGELLNNLLLWSSTQKSGFTPIKKELHLRTLVNEAIILLRPLHGSNVSLINNVDEDVNIFADRAMIGTVLRNLISNSIKHTHDGSITISANVSRFITEVIVHDTGIGLNVKAANNLFSWKGPSSDNTNRQTSSSLDASFGFGLFISKEFVEQHDGMLTYLSNDQIRGTIFYFTIPALDLLDPLNTKMIGNTRSPMEKIPAA